MSSNRKLADLKEAKYNPRVISQTRLDNLHKSLQTYGDLSGIVFNIHTKTLISGHQRLSQLKSNKIPTKIVTKKVTDEFGTVAEGWVIAKTPAGTIRLPYREVKWSDKKAEMAANVAANAHGGDFDRTKLGVILEALSKDKKFDIDTIGLDPLSIRGLLPKLPDVEYGTEEGDSFAEYGEDSFNFDHECPKCKFQFNSKGTPQNKKEVVKEEPKKVKKKKVIKSSKK